MWTTKYYKPQPLPLLACISYVLLLFDHCKTYLAISPVLTRFDRDTNIFLTTGWWMKRMGYIFMQPNGSTESVAVTIKWSLTCICDFDIILTSPRLWLFLFKLSYTQKNMKKITTCLLVVQRVVVRQPLCVDVASVVYRFIGCAIVIQVKRFWIIKVQLIKLNVGHNCFWDMISSYSIVRPRYWHYIVLTHPFVSLIMFYVTQVANIYLQDIEHHLHTFDTTVFF